MHILVDAICIWNPPTSDLNVPIPPREPEHTVLITVHQIRSLGVRIFLTGVDAFPANTKRKST